MSRDQHYYFICNPEANSGRLGKQWDSVHQEIQQYIGSDSFDWVFTEEPLHAIQLAKTAVTNGYSHIVSVGGDGVANEIANAIMREKNRPVFGMIPGGTSNDAHQTHNFPNDPVESVKGLFENRVEKFAVGKVTGDFGDEPHYFLDHCDVGLAALAANSAKHGTKLLKGEWKYTLYAVMHILKFKRNPGQVTVDGEVFEGEFVLIGAGFGDMMSGYNLWPDNHHRKGDFGVLMARGQSRFQLLKLLLAAEHGNHLGKPGVDYLRGKEILIELERGWPYQAEGEIFTKDSKTVKIEYVPDAISIVTSTQH